MDDIDTLNAWKSIVEKIDTRFNVGDPVYVRAPNMENPGYGLRGRVLHAPPLNETATWEYAPFSGRKWNWRISTTCYVVQFDDSRKLNTIGGFRLADEYFTRNEIAFLPQFVYPPPDLERILEAAKDEEGA